jgi:modification methylase cviBI
VTPIIKYSGGKSRELKNILPEIPDFKGRYIEPFIGGGAVYFHLNLKNSIINDINSNLIRFYSELNENEKSKIDYIVNLYNTNSLENNEKLYYKIRKSFNEKDFSEFSFCLQYYFLNKTVYSGLIRVNKKGELNGAFGKYKKISNKISNEHLDLLSKTEIYNKDFSEIFKLSNEDDFIFLDPPYDCVFHNYGNVKNNSIGFLQDDHIRLSNEFKNSKSKCLMIIGETDFIKDLYKDYIVDSYYKKYNFNIKNRTVSDSNHLIIKNF